MTALIILCTFCYVVLIGTLIIGFKRLKTITLDNHKANHKFSIIIPFRNEADNLKRLMISLSRINYDSTHFEVLLINDDSSDNFMEVLDSFKLIQPKFEYRVINSQRISHAPKKDALLTGINAANYEWIITTDADCTIPTEWLRYFDQVLMEKSADMVCGPVALAQGSEFMHHFQQLHFTSLIGSGIGAFGLKKPFLCNGANLCYNKGIFIEIGGFKDHLNIAGGDDVLLMEKFLKNSSSSVHFIKNKGATVVSKSQSSWKGFFAQQIRWAAKTKHSSNLYSKIIGLLVLCQNLLIIVLFAAAFIEPNFWFYFLVSFTGKIIVDNILIAQTSSFLKQSISMLSKLGASLLHPGFIVITGLLSQFKKFGWKQRVYKP